MFQYVYNESFSLFLVVVDSGPFRLVSAFMNAKPYVKVVSKTAATLLETLKLIKHR